jgi:hypothetical protein
MILLLLVLILALEDIKLNGNAEELEDNPNKMVIIIIRAYISASRLGSCLA